MVFEGGEIPTTADEQSACARARGKRDRDGRLTVAASGRLSGGKMRRAFSEFRGRHTRDLSGVLWVVVGMVSAVALRAMADKQNEVRNADTLKGRDRVQCNKPVADRPTRPALGPMAQGGN